MAKDAALGIVITPEFRAAHTNLFEKKAFQRNGKDVGDPVYSFLAMFPKTTDITALKQKAKAVAVAEWGAEGLAGVKWPFKDGDAEAVRQLEKSAKMEAEGKGKAKSEDQVAYLRGNILLKAKTMHAPKVGDNRGEDILDKSKVYSGIWGRAELNFKANEVEGNKYVTPYFNFFMKTRDDKRLAGRDLKTVFKGLLGDDSNDDPTKALDDDIPF